MTNYERVRYQQNTYAREREREREEREREREAVFLINYKM